MFEGYYSFQHEIFSHRTILLTIWLLATGGNVLKDCGTFGIWSLAGRNRNTGVQLNKVVTVPEFSARSPFPDNPGYNSSPHKLQSHRRFLGVSLL